MVLHEIVEKIGFKILAGQESLQAPVTHAYISDILSDVMARSQKGTLWITNQTHMNVIAIVFFKSLSGVVFPEGLIPDDDVLAKAREKHIAVLSSELSAFDIAGRLYAMGIRG
ncbi:serine kinase [candidate division KSB1 bacterium]|nr:serine kinase [candidate division KSB1 bacterium]